MMAASVTDLAIGPAVSWSSDSGTMPCRLTRPVDGRIPTSMLAFDGPSIEPPVLVPTATSTQSATPTSVVWTTTSVQWRPDNCPSLNGGPSPQPTSAPRR